MMCEVEIQSGGEGIAEGTHLRIDSRVFFTSQARDLQSMVESIFIKGALAIAIDFGDPTESLDKILLNAPEIVLGLRISETEHSAGVGTPENMRDSVGVAIDRHLFCQSI